MQLFHQSIRELLAFDPNTISLDAVKFHERHAFRIEQWDAHDDHLSDHAGQRSHERQHCLYWLAQRDLQCCEVLDKTLLQRRLEIDCAFDVAAVVKCFPVASGNLVRPVGIEQAKCSF